MSSQQTLQGIAELRSLLADPAPRIRGAGRRGRTTDDSLRVALACADTLQIVLVCLLTRSASGIFTDVLGPAQALGLGLTAAGLAAMIRRAIRPSDAEWLHPASGAALRASVATCSALAAVGAVLLLSRPVAESYSVFVPWILTWTVASGALSAGLRFGLADLAGRFATAVPNVAIVGAPQEALPVAEALRRAHEADWRFVGQTDDRVPEQLDNLVARVQAGDVQVVTLAIPSNETARIARLREMLVDQPVLVCLAFDAGTACRLPEPRGLRVVDIGCTPHRGWPGIFKRILDLGLGTSAIILLGPVLLAAALAVHLESPGPILFRQWRFGAGSRPIQILKFRTMRSESCDVTGEHRTTSRDPRVTRIGRILRRTSIDELPQLFNVLRGDMSLVGPRPHPLHMRVEGAYYFEAVERYRARHLVRPGITGWAQVNGSRGEVSTLAKARRRVELDLWYIDNWSIALDLRILLRTALGGFVSSRAD